MPESASIPEEGSRVPGGILPIQAGQNQERKSIVPEHGGPASPPNALQPGQLFADRFEVLTVLGSGGTATVYKVVDRLTVETIALKVLHSWAAENPKTMSDFRREVVMARRLSHRNVVRIFDIGEHDHQLFLSMEFVEGRTLAACMTEKKRLSEAGFMGIFRQFLDALAHVHSAGIIHRDVKPQNVMLTPDGTLKLMDFGLARDKSGRQTVGVMFGTPAYMSPEHIMGQPLSIASDIYSTGCMFYELLTGQRAFQAASLAERCTMRPPRLAADVPGISPHLAAAIERSIEPDPASRFSSVADLRAAVEGPRRQPAAETRHTLSRLLAESPGDIDALTPLLISVTKRVIEQHRNGHTNLRLTPDQVRLMGHAAVEIETLPPLGPQETIQNPTLKYAAREYFIEGALATPESRVAADIYAAGYIFYELFLGRALLRDQFPGLAGNDGDPRWLHWHSDLSRAAKPLAELLPGFPKALSDVVAQLLDKRPEPRTKNLDAMLEALQKADAKRGRTRLIRPADASAQKGRPAGSSIPPATALSPAKHRSGWRTALLGVGAAALFTLMLGLALWFLVPELIR